MLGVMNTNFEWVVEPTEQMYHDFSNEYGSVALSEAINSYDYYYNGYVYSYDLKKCLNVTTGEVVAYEDAGFTHPSFTWQQWTDGTYRDYEENVRLDLSAYENINVYVSTGFTNGKALIVFYNNQARTYYFTIVNESGEFLFDPVGVEGKIGKIVTDGNTVLISSESYGTELLLKTYDMEGNLIAEFDTDSLGVYCSFSVSIGDGVVVIEGSYSYSNYVWYYTTEFEPLF